jgi:YVTN family beta-propeller protein
MSPEPGSRQAPRRDPEQAPPARARQGIPLPGGPASPAGGPGCGRQAAAGPGRCRLLSGRVRVPPELRRLYCGDTAAGTITVSNVDTLRRGGTVQAELGAYGLCVSPDGRWLYACDRGAGTISVLDARSGTESHRIAVGSGPGDCAVEPVTGRLLVSNAGSATLTVVERPWSRWPRPAASHPAVGRQLPEFALPDLRTGRLPVLSSGRRSGTSSASSPVGEEHATRRRRCRSNCAAVPPGQDWTSS